MKENQQLKSAPQKMDSNIVAGFDTAGGFELMMRIANAFANSTIVPKEYLANQLVNGEWVKNPSAISNCTIAVNMAQRMGSDPMMVMQNLVIVHGRPSWSAKFLLATVNACGRFSAIRFEWVGTPGENGWGCRAWANEVPSGERLNGPLITIQLAKDEGWYDKKGSKWKTMPEKMLMYRAGAWWCDIYSPELAMGLRTDDEVQDAFDTEQDSSGVYTVTGVAENQISPLDDVLSSIKSAKSIKELKRVSLTDLSPNDQKTARSAWMQRSGDLNKPQQEKVVEAAEENPINWEQSIKECGDKAALDALMLDMPESVQIEFGDLLDEKFDSLR